MCPPNQVTATTRQCEPFTGHTLQPPIVEEPKQPRRLPRSSFAGQHWLPASIRPHDVRQGPPTVREADADGNCPRPGTAETALPTLYTTSGQPPERMRGFNDPACRWHNGRSRPRSAVRVQNIETVRTHRTDSCQARQAIRVE